MALITQEAKKIKLSKKVIQQSLSKNKMKKLERSPMPIPELAKRQMAQNINMSMNKKQLKTQIKNQETLLIYNQIPINSKVGNSLEI